MHWTTTASPGSVRITNPGPGASRSAGDRRDPRATVDGGASPREELDPIGVGERTPGRRAVDEGDHGAAAAVRQTLDEESGSPSVLDDADPRGPGRPGAREAGSPRDGAADARPGGSGGKTADRPGEAAHSLDPAQAAPADGPLRLRLADRA